MSAVLVDSNVILDVATDDPVWGRWSASTLQALADRTVLVINPIVYAEVCVDFRRIEEVDELLSPDVFVREDLPFVAGFLAAQCFREYRHRGGMRTSPLPDLYIGAHAAVNSYRLLTRDARRYRSYFPRLELIMPGSLR